MWVTRITYKNSLEKEKLWRNCVSYTDCLAFGSSPSLFVLCSDCLWLMICVDIPLAKILLHQIFEVFRHSGWWLPIKHRSQGFCDERPRICLWLWDWPTIHVQLFKSNLAMCFMHVEYVQCRRWLDKDENEDKEGSWLHFRRCLYIMRSYSKDCEYWHLLTLELKKK